MTMKRILVLVMQIIMAGKNLNIVTVREQSPPWTLLGQIWSEVDNLAPPSVIRVV